MVYLFLIGAYKPFHIIAAYSYCINQSSLNIFFDDFSFDEMKTKQKQIGKVTEDKSPKKARCWEVFHCNAKKCPAYKSNSLSCWLFPGTHCRNEVQGKVFEKIEMCLHCKVFKKNTDVASMKATLKMVDKQFKEFNRAIRERDSELESMSMELALSLSEVFEALKKISSGDPTVRIDETSAFELTRKLKHMVNLTSREITAIVNQSHEFAIVLAEHFDVLHRVSVGDMHARVEGKSKVELLASLKKVTNEMIQSISKEIRRREKAETALRKAHDKLEHRVEERTADLRRMNDKMWNEIVERKRAEEDLREAELRYRTVADFTHDWEYWETPDGKLSYVSPSCERITGFTTKDFIDNPHLISDITLQEDNDILLTHRHEAFTIREPQSIEFRIRRKDGEIRWIEHVCQPVTDMNDTFLGVRAGNRDITARKQVEAALRESEQLLIQAHKMEALGRLAAGIAHEINNPLAIINEKAGLMKDIIELSAGFGQNREKFLSLLGTIFESVTRCKTITHRLLGFSRRTEVSHASIDLNAAIQEVIGFLEKEMLFRNIHLELKLAENLPRITSDKRQLEQVVLNILNNAIDVVDKGGIIEIISDVKDENTVRISIRDSGPGIPEEILKHIFEPFFTTKSEGKGTGLGLSISYGIMQKLGGTILVRSELTRGTTFILEIPHKSAEI
jgi:PAS domain S-box-containing protein